MAHILVKDSYHPSSHSYIYLCVLSEPALEYFTVKESETDEARLIFMWKVKYDGGRPINNFLIQYQDVQNSSESKS